MNVSLDNFNLTGKNVAVALSGGQDSMALLYYMLSVKDLYHFNIKAINVEHGIRGQNSIDDTNFVISICQKLSVPLRTFLVDVLLKAEELKFSIEQTARLLRYQCFSQAVEEGFCDYVLTAHHQSDNAETVIFNMCRGAGLKGLKGIDKQNSYILRPLLNVTKQEIIDYTLKHSIPYVSDETNDDTDYTRNYLRHNVLPELKKVFPEAEKSISRLTEIVKEEDAFLEELTLNTIILKDGYAEIPISAHPVIVKRGAILALKHLGVIKDYEKLHAELVDSLKNLNNGNEISLPKNVTAIKEYDKLVLFREQEFNFTPVPLKEGVYQGLNYTLEIKKVNSNISFQRDSLYIDQDKLPKNTVIRLRQEGDVFKKFGGKSKKLKDYFIDKKVPKRLRDKILVGADGKNILFIAGIEISDDLKVDKNTINVLQLKKITKE